MAFVPAIIAGVSALANYLGNRNKQTQTQGTASQSGLESLFGSSTSSTTPNLSPLQQRLADMFTKGYSDLYNSSTNLSPYAQTNLQQIAGQGNANRSIINNILAQRGLSYSPAAAAPLTQNLLNTGNQMTSFLAQLPLLQRQLQQQALEGLTRGFSVLPTATSTTGTQTGTRRFSSLGQQTGDTTLIGNPWGGLVTGLGASLAAPNGKGGTQLGDLLQSLGIGGGSSNSSQYDPNTGDFNYNPQPYAPPVDNP